MIRDAGETDRPAIVAVYNAAIPGRLATADTEPGLGRIAPRVAERARGEAASALGHGTQRPDRRVAERHPFYGRVAYAGTAELSVYVDSAAHRAGIATELMTHALARAASRCARSSASKGGRPAAGRSARRRRAGSVDLRQAARLTSPRVVQVAGGLVTGADRAKRRALDA